MFNVCALRTQLQQCTLSPCTCTLTSFWILDFDRRARSLHERGCCRSQPYAHARNEYAEWILKKLAIKALRKHTRAHILEAEPESVQSTTAAERNSQCINAGGSAMLRRRIGLETVRLLIGDSSRVCHARRPYSAVCQQLHGRSTHWRHGHGMQANWLPACRRASQSSPLGETPTRKSTAVTINIEGANLTLDPFWLRHHCKCPSCYNSKTNQRSYANLDRCFDSALTVSNVRLLHNSSASNSLDKVLEIAFSDGHVATYSFAWIEQATLPHSSKHPKRPVRTGSLVEPALWNYHTVALEKVAHVDRAELESSTGMRRLLESLVRFGFGFVENVKPTVEDTQHVIERVAPVQQTIFGKMWTFSNEQYDHADTAYGSEALSLHTDTTYMHSPVGLQIFHVLQPSSLGGETVLVDGFHAAAQLRKREPALVDFLLENPVSFEFIENGVHLKCTDTILKMDAVTDRYSHIRFNKYDLATVDTIPQSHVGIFYDAFYQLMRHVESRDNCIKLPLQPGTVLFIDNWRVLHGRTAIGGSRTRTVCGAYVNVDDWRSKARLYELVL